MIWKSNLNLRVIDGQFEPSNALYFLKEKQIDIGRLPKQHELKEHEVLFREPTLSRVHVTLTWQARKNGYELEHKSEVNSTLVNGRPVEKILLAPGDRIQMGLLILELEETSEARAGSELHCHSQVRAEIRRRLHAIVAEVEQEFSHVSRSTELYDIREVERP